MSDLDQIGTTEHFKVKLEPQFRGDGYPVVFHVSPDVTENRNVQYKTLDPVHMPGSIHVYNNTASRTYQVSSIKLISRTTDEATANLARINILRSWTVGRFGTVNSKNKQNATVMARQEALRKELSVDSYFGAKRAYEKAEVFQDSEGLELLGTPPAIVLLSAYASSRHRGNVYKIPCVITNLTIPYPTDVDYISTNTGEPFPTIMTVDISMTEVHSPREYQNFNLSDFRNGILENF